MQKSFGKLFTLTLLIAFGLPNVTQPLSFDDMEYLDDPDDWFESDEERQMFEQFLRQEGFMPEGGSLDSLIQEARPQPLPAAQPSASVAGQPVARDKRSIYLSPPMEGDKADKVVLTPQLLEAYDFYAAQFIQKLHKVLTHIRGYTFGIDVAELEPYLAKTEALDSLLYQISHIGGTPEEELLKNPFLPVFFSATNQSIRSNILEVTQQIASLERDFEALQESGAALKEWDPVKKVFIDSQAARREQAKQSLARLFAGPLQTIAAAAEKVMQIPEGKKIIEELTKKREQEVKEAERLAQRSSRSYSTSPSRGGDYSGSSNARYGSPSYGQYGGYGNGSSYDGYGKGYGGYGGSGSYGGYRSGGRSGGYGRSYPSGSASRTRPSRSTTSYSPSRPTRTTYGPTRPATPSKQPKATKPVPHIPVGPAPTRSPARKRSVEQIVQDIARDADDFVKLAAATDQRDTAYPQIFKDEFLSSLLQNISDLQRKKLKPEQLATLSKLQEGLKKMVPHLLEVLSYDIKPLELAQQEMVRSLQEKNLEVPELEHDISHYEAEKEAGFKALSLLLDTQIMAEKRDIIAAALIKREKDELLTLEKLFKTLEQRTTQQNFERFLAASDRFLGPPSSRQFARTLAGDDPVQSPTPFDEHFGKVNALARDVYVFADKQRVIKADLLKILQNISIIVADQELEQLDAEQLTQLRSHLARLVERAPEFARTQQLIGSSNDPRVWRHQFATIISRVHVENDSLRQLTSMWSFGRPRQEEVVKLDEGEPDEHTPSHGT